MIIFPYCNEKRYQTQKSKNKGALLTGIVVFLMIFIPHFFDISLGATLGLFTVWIVTFFPIYPYIVKLSSTEKYITFLKNKR